MVREVKGETPANNMVVLNKIVSQRGQ